MSALVRRLTPILFAALLVAGCRGTQPIFPSVPAAATPIARAATDTSPPAATPAPPTSTPPPSATPVPPTPTPPPEPSTTPVPTPEPTPTLEQEALFSASFVPGECRFNSSTAGVECGDLIVLQDREKPDGATVSLHVAIFRSYSPNPEPDPVIYLMGGGGGNALGLADYYMGTIGDRIRATRDFIMYNQRGTHLNEPFLGCPGEIAFQRELDGQGLSQEEKDARSEAFLLDCRDALQAQGVDLAMYNSVTNAADANDLRLALGYEQVNYYGTSYGTRLALAIMRYYPASVRSVILDSVFPPQVDYPSDVISSFVASVNRVFAACSADTTCGSKYSDLEESFYLTINELEANPREIDSNGHTVFVDGKVFMDAIYMALHRASAIPNVPFAIRAASQGDLSPLQWAIESLEGYSQNVATGVYYSSLCRDEVNFDSYEHSLEVAASYPPQWAGYFELSSFFRTCEFWGAGRADPVENQAVMSSVPALVFAGHFDPITTPEWGQLAAETLSHSYYFEFPNMGHGVMRSDPCALRIGLQFLDDPLNEPDASCLAELTVPGFR